MIIYFLAQNQSLYQSMEKERKNPATVGPSFVMTLINDYSTILRLPIDFVRKYWGLMPAENVKLRIKSGKTWDVRIDGEEEEEEEEGGGECFFTEGWSKFVKDLVVEEGQILVLRLNIGEGEAARFDVWVYGHNGCEREDLHLTPFTA